MLRLLALILALWSYSAGVAARPPSVLLIHSYHQGMPWTDGQHRGFADVLTDDGQHADLHVEYLDALRHRQQKALMGENLLRTLQGKFQGHPPDVIAVSDNDALDFVLAARPQFAPEAPVVFCGINGLPPDIRERYGNLTGVAEEASFLETLEVMEQLFPGRRILVLGESSSTFRGNFGSLQRANEQRRSPAPLDVFDDPVLSHIEARVRQAGPDTLVFILLRPVNDQGETVDSATAVRAISQASPQPVFSAWDYMFGHGIVGGKLTSGEAHGETAARQVLRILNGEAADAIPIEWESPNRYLFDHRQLARFGLEGRPLPEGSIVINRPASFYAENRDKVLAVAVVFTLLLLIGIRLLVLNRSLRESRDLLDAIVENLPVMLFMKRASDLSFVRLNRAGEALLGRTRDDLLGRHDYDLFPKEQADFFIQKDREVLKQSEVVNIPEESIETARGSRILHTRKLVLRNREGTPLYLLGISEDITERKQAEYRVTLLSFALNGVHEAAFLIDEQARFHFVNDEACRILGYSREELLALGVADVDPDFPADRWPDHWRALRERKSLTFEGRHRTKAGCIVPVEINANFIDYAGQHYNLALVRDITERKQAQEELLRHREHLEETVQQRTEELRQARDAAEAASRAKSLFLANMSHELRTPLNAILGFSGMMRREAGLSDTQREALDIINRSGEHLLGLINDVLEIAKIESGKQRLDITPFDLGGMVRDVCEMMYLRAKQKGLSLALDQSSGFPRYVRGDEAKLRQILVNLVGNAIKFTEQGGVIIHLGFTENARHHLLIEVEDTGAGIPPEGLARLFQPFVQLAGGAAQGGSGLGLSIARQFAQLMGGDIVVESTVGKGSRFRVDLPMELADEKELPQPPAKGCGEVIGLAPGQLPPRILIAEDHAENRLLLGRLMSTIGIEAQMAEGGERCVEIFQTWRPDLIWMDRRMPEVDGLEATRRIRALPGGDRVKIVAVTASAFEEERRELLAAGMDDVVRKPYRFEEIYDCLARQLGVAYRYAGGSEKSAAVAPLTPAALAGLEEELRSAFREDLLTLNAEGIAVAIRRIGERDPALARTLSALAENFDYAEILRALDAAPE